MSSDWAMLTFSEAPFSIIDGDRGTNYPKQHDFSSTGHCLFLNAGNVTKDGFSFTDCAFISEEKDLSLRKGKLQRQDIVLTTRGTVGNVAYYSDGIKFESIRINSGMVIFRPDSSKILPYYLYLFLRSSSFAEQVKSLTSGSAQPQLPIRDMNRITIPVPSLEIQAEICFLLGAVDDRIALLRETNTTLEAIAQALFKSWFVDFDPVHANAGTQAPSLPPEIQALFPATFTDSPKGPIPDGWSVKACQEIIDVRDGTHASPKPSETGYPLVTSRHITSGEISLDDAYLISEAEYLDISKRSKVDHLDVLLTMIGTVGIPAFVLSESTDFAIKNIGLFKTSKRPDFSAYIYLLLKSKEMQNYLHARMVGTTQKYLSLKALREIAIIEPSPEIIKAFSENIQPIFEGIQNNRVQVQALTDLRDTLLPRLISGQLRLPETEQAIAAITD